MINVVEFFTHNFGVGGNVLVAFIFLALAVAGVIIAMRGRGAMVWIVSVCGFVVGVLAGAMLGILVFNSLIMMIILAAVGGVLLLYGVRSARSIGYFIGIGTLGWLLSYIVTSEMYIGDSGTNENILLLIDFAVGVFMGFLAALRSKYIVSLVTAIAGGLLAAISTLAIFGSYFADAKTWTIAGAVAVLGLMVQIKTYDIKPTKKKKGR